MVIKPIPLDLQSQAITTRPPYGHQGNLFIQVSVTFFQVTIQFDQSNVQPKTPVTLVVTADEGSLVNVLAVDKSVLLMADGNDITPDRVS